jgi:hypothetical protein
LRTYFADDCWITNVVDSLHNPSHGPIVKHADSGIELDFGRRVARLDLSDGLVDNVPMGRPLDAELQ